MANSQFGFWRSGCFSFAALALSASAAYGVDITSTRSTTESAIFNPATVTVTNSTNYLTTILGSIVGGTPLYNSSFALPFANPIVQTGVGAARLAITAAGGPGINIFGPVLTASSTTTSSVSHSIYILAGTAVASTSENAVGPVTIQTGQRTVCTGINTLPGPMRPACGPGAPVANVAAGQLNVNRNTETTYTIKTDTTTANTTSVSEAYTLTGQVQAIGQVHGLASQAIGDQSERFTRRMLDAANDERAGMTTNSGPIADIVLSTMPQAADTRGRPAAPPAATNWNAFANAYAWRGHRSASGAIPGDRRNAVGIEGGLAFEFNDNIRVGAGASQGRLDLKLTGGHESMRIDLTEFGVFARFREGGFQASAAATMGFGRIGSSIVPLAGAASTASYNARVYSIAGEAGYKFNVSDFQVTPHIGGQFQRISIGSFIETGTFALTSSGGDNNRSKGWAGVSLRRDFQMIGMGAAVLAYGRFLVTNADAANLSASFVGTAVPLTIASPRVSRTGLEAGIAFGFQPVPSVDLTARYDTHVREKLVSHTATAGLRVWW